MLSDYSPPQVDRIWGIMGSYYNIPKAIFYLLKGDYRGFWFEAKGSGSGISGFGRGGSDFGFWAQGCNLDYSHSFQRGGT